MPQNSQELSAHNVYTRRTTAALVPAVVHRQTSSLDVPPPRRRSIGWGALPLLWLFALLAEGLLFFLFPFLPGLKAANDPLQQALPGLFPWLSLLDWTSYFPQGLHWLASLPWFDPTHSAMGNADIQLLALGLIFLLSLLAARIGGGLVHARNVRVVTSLFVLFVLFFTLIFGISLALTPVPFNAMSHDMLAYGLYGRMVVIYHVNPYVMTLQHFTQDMLHQATTVAPGASSGTAPYGPVWLDLSLLVALFAHESVANILLGFRALGLVVHVVNAILIWHVLTRVKPELRLSGMVLYAWNPAVLLLSVFVMHQEVVVVLFLLLAIVFLLRKSPLMAWIFALLAVLTNPFVLLVLPLFLIMCVRQSSKMRFLRLVSWWLGFWIATILMLALAYIPYWQDMGLHGLVANLLPLFWQRVGINSLDSALLALPMQLPASVTWVLLPQHWALIALGLVGCFLLFALWFANTVELLTWCACWLFLLLAFLMPVYWPWLIIVPLALALCAARNGTIDLAVLFSLGALLGYYCWLMQPVWSGQALVAVGMPVLLWGWTLFFASTSRMMRANATLPEGNRKRSAPRFWFSRPPRASQP